MITPVIKISNKQILHYLKKVLQTPEVFGLVLNETDEVNIAQIIEKSPALQLSTQDIIDACNSSDNNVKIILNGDMVRYQNPVPSISTRQTPPDILYFHTTSLVWNFFRHKNGIGKSLPNRLFELSDSTIPPSIPISEPITLIIDAKAAHLSNSVHFFLIDQKWHATFIPNKFILND